MNQFRPATPGMPPEGALDGQPPMPSLEREQARLLQAHHVTTTDRLATALAGSLGSVNVSLVSLAETTVDAHRTQEDTPVCCLGFGLKGTPAGWLECSESLAVLILDCLLGLAGSEPRDTRALGEIERQLLLDALRPAADAYAETWKGQAALQIRTGESDLEADSNEPLYVATCELRTAQSAGRLHLVLRLPAWRTVLASVPRTPKPAPSRVNTALLGTIGECLVPARALLGSVPITVRDLLSMRPGDIICLESPADAPLEIRVGNQPKLLGRAAIQHGRYVITIEQSAPRGKA